MTTTTDSSPVTDLSVDDVRTEPELAARPPSEAGPLVPVSVTAERERERLRLTGGRRGPARALVLVPPAIRHLGSAEAAQNGLRYRPVAWTFIAIVALAFYLPGRADRATPPQPVAAPSPVVPADPAPPPEAPQAPSTPDFTPVTALPSFSPTPAPSGPADGPTTPTTAPPAPDQGPVAVPLGVRGWGWATRLPATPLPTDRVADDAVPVANRLGSVDRVSFLRLSGDDTELVLVEHADSAREALGPGAVAICPVLDDAWEEGPDQSFDDAPAWETEMCIAGVEDDDRWTFDLSGFDERAGDAGFALVPTVDAPADFQVAFEVDGV